MSRQARKKSSSGIYHLMLRGVNRQRVFEDDKDCRRIIETLFYYKPISRYEVYAYCLMSNHMHLLLRETEESISQAIKRISSSYVHWYNKKYERCGHLFQERFKSEAVENDQYFLTVLRYIHQNPVKAGITKDIDAYPWSSYQEYVGTPVITDVDFALEMFSADRNKAVALFRSFNSENNDDQCLEYNEKPNLSDQELIKILSKLDIVNINEIARLEKGQRDNVLKKIKGINGVKVRQISRLTGISRGVIDKI